LATSKPPPSSKEPPKSGAGMYVAGVLVLAAAMAGLFMYKSGDDTPKEQVQTTLQESAAPPPPPPPAFAPPPPPEIEEEEDAGAPDKPTGVGRPGGKGPGLCSNCGSGKSSAALNSALRATAGSAKGCYNRALRTSAVSGTMTVSVQVGPNGTVCGASIANDSVGSSEIASCVTGRFAGKQFPPPESGCVVVNIPISFELKE
jgi:TonB family protein